MNVTNQQIRLIQIKPCNPETLKKKKKVGGVQHYILLNYVPIQQCGFSFDLSPSLEHLVMIAAA